MKFCLFIGVDGGEILEGLISSGCLDCEEGGMMQVHFMYVLILRKFFCFGGEWGNFFFLANFNRNERKRRKMLREYRYLLLIIRIK